MNAMNNHPSKGYFKTALTFFALLFSVTTFSQGTESVDVNFHKDNNGSPWMWVVGIAVFILLLAALLRNRRGNA